MPVLLLRISESLCGLCGEEFWLRLRRAVHLSYAPKEACCRPPDKSYLKKLARFRSRMRFCSPGQHISVMDAISVLRRRCRFLVSVLRHRATRMAGMLKMRTVRP